jgi:hypothetical protein
MANLDRVEFPVSLACGCRSAHVIDGMVKMACPVHGPWIDILAFELREWHMKCQQCVVGKWTGKDKTAAQRAKTRHRASRGHEHIVIDFMIPDSIKRIWKIHYGRKRIPARYIKDYA